MPLPALHIVGNLTRGPEVKFLPSGTSVTTLRVAASDRKRDKDGNWTDGDPCYLDVEVWRETGENVAESLAKGDRVVILGRLRMRTYTHQDGREITVYTVEADDIAPSLKGATARVTKRKGGGTRPAPASDPWADDNPPF